MKKNWSGKCFVLYDGRARSGDTDEATALVTAHTEHQARTDNGDWAGYEAIWFEYDAVNGVSVKETMRPDIKVRSR